MRILLTFDGLLSDEPVGRATRELAAALRAAGEDVRAVVLDRGPSSDPNVMSIICDPASMDADVPFPPPAFEATNGRLSFADLDDLQLAMYRDMSRIALDGVIERFEPHLIHAQHVWVQGHLALESGVPYVLTAWGPELDLCRKQSRYARFAEQAAENASTLVAVGSQVEDKLQELFADIEKPLVMSEAVQSIASDAERWLNIYRGVLRQRFGDRVPE